MPFDDFQLALAHYRMMFPTLADLGIGTPPAIWQTEYNRVLDSGFSAVLLTASSFEGGTASSQRNFDQKILMRALMTRRVELDPTFDDTVFALPAVKRTRSGFSVRLHP